MRHHVILISLLTLCIGLTVWVTNMDKVGVMAPFTYEDIWEQTQRHVLLMVFPSVLMATLIAVPLGVLLTRGRFRRLAPSIMGIASAGMAIPSVAILAIMIPIFLALGMQGFGIRPALVALVLWGVLPILRNSYVAIDNINPGVLNAARGMGMTPAQIAWKIELPLALPVIMAGIRVATVILVGTATLAAIIGARGLGHFILVGLYNSEPLITLQGAAPAAAIAIVLSVLLGYLEKLITPRGIRIETAS